MDIRAVAFDLGQTLVYYNNPLNWQRLYSPAIKGVMDACGFGYNREADEKARQILTKYNTRVNHREHEFSSDTIFTEILNAWSVGTDRLMEAKKAFYSYFQSGAACYGDAEHVLRELKSRGIKAGVLTDVAYGMDNEYALNDLSPVLQYIDVCLTSNDIGYRKPNKRGYEDLQRLLGVEAGKMAFVGDEEKDIAGANSVGMVSVLISRDGTVKCYMQDYTFASLTEILMLLDD